jgi:MFS family permease
LIVSVLALSISAAVVMLGFGIIVPFLPYYAQMLGTTSGLEVGLLTSAFLLTRTFLAAPAGALSDRLGRKRLILAGLLIYTVVSVLFGTAQSWQELLVYRAIQGVASAMVWPPATALIGDLTPPGRRGNAIGIYNAISMSGWAIGPGVGGSIKWYAENVLHMGLLDSYRAPFYACAIASAAALLLVVFTVKSPQVSAAPGGKKPLQMRLPFREIDEKYRKTIIAMLFVGLSYGFATAFIEPLLAYFVQHEYALSYSEATDSMSVIFTVAGVIMLFTQLYAGRLADRFSKRKMIAIFTSLAQLFTIVMPISKNVTEIGVMMSIRSALYSMTSPAYTALQQDLFPRRVRGALTGLFETFFGVGSFLGPIIGFIVYDNISHSMPFLLSGILGLLTIFALVIVAKEPKPEESSQF